jgi:hypothetical protein
MFRYGDTTEKQIKIFLSEYDTAALEGKKLGVNVLLGAEVAIVTRVSPYTEFLLFGTDKEFFLKNPALYGMTQEKLYKACSDSGILVYQAHPLRREQGHAPADAEFVDGVEVNNHPNYLRKKEEIYEFADKHGLGVTCGSDFHYVSQAGSAGIYAPDGIKSERDLAEYLKKNKRPKIFYK